MSQKEVELSLFQTFETTMIWMTKNVDLRFKFVRRCKRLFSKNRLHEQMKGDNGALPLPSSTI